MSTAGKAIKNSLYLYIKLGISSFAVLYSTRLILASLGEIDYGIFNVIAGGIGLLGFLNGTLANATQRFMSYAEGQGDILKKKQVFNVSIILHLIIGILTVLILYAVMSVLFNKVLNIEPTRIQAAKIVYFCLIFSTFITIINVPYEAVLTSHENMLFYSLLGIFEALLKLIIAIICVYSDTDKLICYSILMGLLPLVTLTVMKIYCHRSYEECNISLKKYWSKPVLNSISSFCGWNILTSMSILITYQGNGLILNHFFGSILNAAQGIASQVNGQLSSLSINMMRAVNPIIIKKIASDTSENANIVTLSSCKLSTYLILLLAVPFVLEMNGILNLWLKDVPAWTAVFCIMQLIFTVIVQTTSPIATSIYATGNIKMYAIFKSIMNIIPIFLLYLCFYLVEDPIWLYIPMILFLGIGGNIVILYYAKKECQLKIHHFLRYALLPIIGTTIIMFILGTIINSLFSESILRIGCCILATSVGLLVSLFTIGLSKDEKIVLFELVKNARKPRN